ncbi:hypothetical protein ACTDI4_01590 [Mesorhizobium sp. PUT5]|uniref:hypothetical protein n=1 Tax=Mesorhizobium sp. PUT5 TaxID=3454629 RepID=UPI003FA42FCB
MQTFSPQIGDELADRYTEQLESALMARALADAGALPDERTRAMLSCWIVGVFNSAAAELRTLAEGRGELSWQLEGDGFRLVWQSPTGLACHLARVYPQANDTWAALIVAGVRDDVDEAMAAAEWGVSRLSA